MIILFVLFGAFYFILAAVDLPLQKQLHANKLKMTREELKKEVKQSEGDPQLKQQRREKAQKISRSEMLSNVKDATVVMVNPEHYAVALKYREGDMAPKVVAKGRALMALTIIRIAEEAGVEVVVNKPLAREMYRTVKEKATHATKHSS